MQPKSLAKESLCMWIVILLNLMAIDSGGQILDHGSILLGEVLTHVLDQPHSERDVHAC